MKRLLVAFLLVAVLIAARDALVQKCRSVFGDLLFPVAALAGSVALFAAGLLPLEMRCVFPLILLNAIFWGLWLNEREKRRVAAADEEMLTKN